MRISLFILSASLCMGQTKLPNWAGFGGEYSTSDSPHFSGWAALAVPVSQPAQIYSFSMYQGLIQQGKLVTSTTAGLGTILKTQQLGSATAYLIGVGTAGVANGTATTAAFSGGGFLVVHFKRGWTLEAGGLQNKTGAGAKPNLLVGGGFTW